MKRRGFLLGSLALLWPMQAAALSVYVAEDGQVLGPFDAAALKTRILSKAEAAKTLVWMQGMNDWTPASQVPALAGFVAGLPIETPFDAAKFIIGSWKSDTQVIETKKKVGVMGTISFIFRADGTYSGQKSGAYFHSRATAGADPSRPEIDTQHYIVNLTMTGTYEVTLGQDGYFSVHMKGKSVDNSTGAEGATRKGSETYDFRQLGPILMQTRYGVKYHRASY